MRIEYKVQQLLTYYTFKCSLNEEVFYVINKATGCSLPYNKGRATVSPSYKAESFYIWNSAGRAARRKAFHRLNYSIEDTLVSFKYNNSPSMVIIDDVCDNNTCLKRPDGYYQDLKNSFVEKNELETLWVEYTDRLREQNPNLPTIQKEEKESTMYDTCVDVSEKSVQRSHLRDTASNFYHDHEKNLRKEFYLDDDQRPKTVKEMLQRIKDGLFIAPDEKEEERLSKNWGYSPWQNITWRDPSKTANRDGFNDAMKKMEDAYADLLDDIAILDPAEGLTKVRAFRDTKFS